MPTLDYELFSVSAPHGWADITAELEPGAPITLAQPDKDSGALQFSVGAFRAGPRPDADTSVLVEMLDDFAATRALTRTSEVRTASSPCHVAMADHTDGEFHMRVWYLSDGENFALATHTSGVFDPDEFEAADGIVRTLRWRP